LQHYSPIAKLVRLRIPKFVGSLSYADYRLKTNVVILLDMGHTLRKDHTWEGMIKEGNQILECG
jgi:hypothetical protein